MVGARLKWDKLYIMQPVYQAQTQLTITATSRKTSLAGQCAELGWPKADEAWATPAPLRTTLRSLTTTEPLSLPPDT